MRERTADHAEPRKRKPARAVEGEREREKLGRPNYLPRALSSPRPTPPKLNIFTGSNRLSPGVHSRLNNNFSFSF